MEITIDAAIMLLCFGLGFFTGCAALLVAALKHGPPK